MKKISKKQIFLLLIIVVGLVIALVVVRQAQNLRGRAEPDVNAGLVIKDESGNDLEYQGNNTYKTSSQTIQIGIKDVEQLK